MAENMRVWLTLTGIQSTFGMKECSIGCETLRKSIYSTWEWRESWQTHSWIYISLSTLIWLTINCKGPCLTHLSGYSLKIFSLLRFRAIGSVGLSRHSGDTWVSLNMWTLDTITLLVKSLYLTLLKTLKVWISLIICSAVHTQSSISTKLGGRSLNSSMLTSTKK